MLDNKILNQISNCLTHITCLLLPPPGDEGLADGQVPVQGGHAQQEGAQVGTKHLWT